MNRLLGYFIFAIAVLGATSVSRATLIQYGASLSGPNESPTNSSPGTGTALVDYDTVAHTLRVRVAFFGLTGTTTASHIHAATTTAGTGTAGVATVMPAFPGFPLGVTSGSLDTTLDLTSSSAWNAPFVTAASPPTNAGAETALAAALAADKAYFNIHTSTFGGGEIRGFLLPVPEPSTWLLMASGIVGLGLFKRMRRTEYA